MEYFTSDLHLGHKRCAMEFRAHLNYENVDEHDEFILETLNKYIKENDKVFHLGDFSFGNPEKYLSRLKGQWFFIVGNHDDKNKLINACKSFGFKFPVEILDYRSEDGTPITMCHYPMITWNKSHHGAWQLHGHHHGAHGDTEKVLPDAKRMNVAWDCVGYKPLTFQEVKSFMDKKKGLILL